MIHYRYIKDGEHMCTKNELNTILSRMSEAYRTIYGDEIKKILLYGSYARGDNEKCKRQI